MSTNQYEGQRCNEKRTPDFASGTSISTPLGDIPSVSPKYTWRDLLGTWKARWGIGRMDYKVEPGIYGMGKPDENSPLFVSANYKMSFDCLRRSLFGTDAWILVLDTDGINVWCAAGKKTFATQNLIKAIAVLKLNRLVAHKTVIVPQLGAPGVCATEVHAKVGFNVVFGPVRAEDIPAFLNNEMKTTPEMRRVHFNFADRAAVVPMELVLAMAAAVKFLGVLFLLNILRLGYFTPENTTPYLLAVLTGAALVPLFLPFIPVRSFALKGALAGAVLAVLCYTTFRRTASWREISAGLLLLPVISSYLALNFTGATTFTSPSGVNRELKIALPLQITMAILGTVITISGVFA